MFLDSLIGAADSGLGEAYAGYAPLAVVSDEALDDHTFNFRSKGLNVDFMTFSALALANNSREVLADPAKLANISSSVFSTFFRHFVSDNLTDGGWAFQKVGATLPWDLGLVLDTDYGYNSSIVQDENSTFVTNTTAQAVVEFWVDDLTMSTVAFALSVAALGFLAITSMLAFGYYHSHFKVLPRDVDSLASVMGFVYGSPKLLNWAVGRGRGGIEDSNPNPTKMGWNGRSRKPDTDLGDTWTKLGRFQGPDEKQRWGIEIVEPDVVEMSRIETTKGDSKYTQVQGVSQD
jgi:hypothetical protein